MSPKRRSRARPAPQQPRAQPTTVGHCLQQLSRRFIRARLHFGHGTDNALDEAAWLVGHVAGIAPAALPQQRERKLTAAQRARAQQLMQQRIRTRKPLAYLIHEAWFAGARFYVDERVIVPRSHLAEFIQERLHPWIDGVRVRRVLDLGTGSGCIAIAVARAFPRAHVDAADVSADALAVAALNVARHRLARRIRLIRSDVYAALGDARYDVILSNPPYVAHAELARLPAEFRHEPTGAFRAGADGLALIKRILAHAADRLEPGGVLVVETGNSAARLQRAFARVPFVWLTTDSGDESVFLLTADALAQYRSEFERALPANCAPTRSRPAATARTSPRSRRRSGARSRGA